MSNFEDTEKVFSGDDVEIVGPTGTALATADDNIRHRLPVFEEARTAIRKAATIDECLEWDSLIDAAKAYAYKTKQPEMSMDMAKLDLYNRRRLGEVIEELRRRGLLYRSGNIRLKNGSLDRGMLKKILHAKGSYGEIAEKYGVSLDTVGMIKDRYHIARSPEIKTLAECGVSAGQASTAQRIASIPANKFEGWIAEREAAGKPPTKTSALYFADRLFTDKNYTDTKGKDSQRRLHRLRGDWGAVSPSTHLTFLKWAMENTTPQTQQQFIMWLDQWFAEKHGAGKDKRTP